MDVGEEEQTACCDQTAAMSSSTLARPPDTSGSCTTHSVGKKNQGEVPGAVVIPPFETRFLPKRALSQEVEEKLPSFWLLVLAHTEYEKRNRGSDVFVPITTISG